MAGRVKVIKEADTGRNELFQNTRTRQIMTRAQFAKKIDNGKYPNYHNRMLNGIKTPVSNPDDTEKNNLG